MNKPQKGEMAEDVKQNFSRAEAIQILKDRQNEGDFAPHDRLDLVSMSNEELGAQLCVSGYIEEKDFGQVSGE